MSIMHGRYFNMNMKILYSICIIGILLGSSCSIASSSFQNAKEIHEEMTLFSKPSIEPLSLVFSQPYPLSDLSHFREPSPLLPNTDHYHKTISFEFEQSSCSLRKINNIYTIIDMEELTLSGSPGNPLIPMKTIEIVFPDRINIVDMRVVDGEYYHVENSIFPAPKPEPFFWSEVSNTYDIDRLIPDIKTYTSDSWYPGEIFSYDVGYDKENTVVYLRIYPVQYRAFSQEALFISNGKIEVSYTCEINDKSQTMQYDSWENIIISPPSFYEEAVKLCNFHNAEGTVSMVVNTTWISENYEEADNPPFPGYDNLSTLTSFVIEDQIHDYDFSLAKKIISFLNDTSKHPELTFVTLLGNARMVPPSYYVFYSGILVPTDFFYASPEYDMITDFKVGRLSVDTVQQADHVVNKIMNWNATTELFANVTVAGGEPFGTSFDIGEMIIVDMINQGFLRGIEPLKCFRTENLFNSENVSHALRGNTGILYHIGHGSGTAMALEDEVVCVEDVMALPSSDTTPIVVSIACMNGAYDTHLANLSYNLSFGESILMSDAGGIAYIGGSRSNSGFPIFSLDDGYLLISDETYMARMLTYVFEAYANDTLTYLGDLTDHALSEYVRQYDLKDSMDLYTLFCFTLLGDPALRIPERPTGIEYETPVVSVGHTELMIGSEKLSLPFLDDTKGDNLLPLHPIANPVEYPFISTSSVVEIKIVDCFNQTSPFIEKETYVTMQDKGTHYFTAERSSLYRIQVSSKDGKEGWLFSAASRMVDDDYSDQTDGSGICRFIKIGDAIDASEEHGIIYVQNGIYHERLLIHGDYFLIGENRSNTIIDANDQGTVLTMDGSSSMISGFTLMNAGNHEESAGIDIVDGYPMISDNIIKNNGKYGIKFHGKITIPALQSNIIENNHYGILLDAPIYYGNIDQNILDNNSVGIYCSQMSSQLLPLIISFNKITAKETCVELDRSDNVLLMFNELSNANIGLYLDEVENVAITCNNFYENEISARFNKGKQIIWLGNYWDQARVLPKFIFGTRGYFGCMPWINIDIMPADEPYPMV